MNKCYEGRCNAVNSAVCGQGRPQPSLYGYTCSVLKLLCCDGPAALDEDQKA